MLTLRIIVVGFALLIAAQSNFQVYMPEAAVTEIPNPMNFTLANFGHIPYGRTIVG
jgi:hypothetical protein